MIQYCSTCILPSTKPDLAFSKDLKCQACVNFANRAEVDWESRKDDFVSRLKEARKKKSSPWDCIIPVSGGKDSTFQVAKVKSLGFNPLAVTSTTCDLSPIGQRNLDNLRNIGVDHVGFSPNPQVRVTLNRIGLEQVGDISWPEHVGIWSIPLRASTMFKVPLIVWGENAQNEYGGPPKMANNKIRPRHWMDEFGGLLGLRVSDLEKTHGISPDDLWLYNFPSNEDLDETGTEGLYLGYFFPWDGLSNATYSQAYGFESWPSVVQGSAVNYENLDNYQTGIHDYFKFLKFGFGRATDILSTHVRRNRLERAEAISLAAKLEGKFPWRYLDKSLEQILKPLGLNVEQFIIICDEFTNSSLFKNDSEGRLVRDEVGSPIKINYDNPTSPG